MAIGGERLQVAHTGRAPRRERLLREAGVPAWDRAGLAARLLRRRRLPPCRELGVDVAFAAAPDEPAFALASGVPRPAVIDNLEPSQA